jgi:hypothetical protein
LQVIKSDLFCLPFSAGTPYLFGLIGPAIKQALGYDQYQINMVATFGNFGA